MRSAPLPCLEKWCAVLGCSWERNSSALHIFFPGMQAAHCIHPVFPLDAIPPQHVQNRLCPRPRRSALALPTAHSPTKGRALFCARRCVRPCSAPLHASATWAGSRRSPTMYLARASPSTARMSNTVTSHRPLSKSCTAGVGGQGSFGLVLTQQGPNSGGPPQAPREGAHPTAQQRSTIHSSPAHLLHQVPPHKAAAAGDQAPALLAGGRRPRARRHGCCLPAAWLTNCWVWRAPDAATAAAAAAAGRRGGLSELGPNAQAPPRRPSLTAPAAAVTAGVAAGAAAPQNLRARSLARSCSVQEAGKSGRVSPNDSQALSTRGDRRRLPIAAAAAAAAHLLDLLVRHVAGWVRHVGALRQKAGRE